MGDPQAPSERRAHQSKKQLLRTIRKETKPPPGFAQWIVVFESRRLTGDLGLFRVEAYSDKKLQWSGGLSLTLPQPKTYRPDGSEVPPTVDWDKLTPGESTFTVLTIESRGKTMWEGAMDFLKRSTGDGKLQDLAPLLKLIGLG